MNRPVHDLLRRAALQQPRQLRGQDSADRRRHRSGKTHVEAAAADPPGDLVGGRGGEAGRRAAQGEAAGLAADQRRRAAVGEDQVREHLLEIRGLLQVQRAELEAGHENPSLALGAHDVSRNPRCVERAVAAHEPDHGPLDAGLQREALDQREVDPRRGEPRAGGQHEKRDAAELVVEIKRRGEGEIGRALLVNAHARTRVGERPRPVGPASSIAGCRPGTSTDQHRSIPQRLTMRPNSHQSRALRSRRGA
jgi:hypothetical protein